MQGLDFLGLMGGVEGDMGIKGGNKEGDSESFCHEQKRGCKPTSDALFKHSIPLYTERFRKQSPENCEIGFLETCIYQPVFSPPSCTLASMMLSVPGSSPDLGDSQPHTRQQATLVLLGPLVHRAQCQHEPTHGCDGPRVGRSGFCGTCRRPNREERSTLSLLIIIFSSALVSEALHR